MSSTGQPDTGPSAKEVDDDLQQRLTQHTITRSLRPVDLAEEATAAPSHRTPPEPTGGDAVAQPDEEPDDISEEATIDLIRPAEPDQSVSSAQTMDAPDVSISDAQTMDGPRREGGGAQGKGQDSRSVALPRHMGNWQELSLLPLPDDPDGVIGAGGQATIYSYVQRELGRDVAVKALRPEGRSYDAIEDLMREACVTARLEHPNIVPVHYLHLPEHDHDAPYWVMKRIHGKALTAHLPGEDDLWPIDRLIDVFRRILDAVGFAHSRGIVHRDLKPDNVLVGAFGEVQVTDWGLAVAVNEEGARGAAPLLQEDVDGAGERRRPTATPPGGEQGSGLSEDIAKLNVDVRSGSIGALLKSSSGGRAGTPAYMAPEQLEWTADDIDERTDVFLLGGILYAMLTGSPPHDLSGFSNAEEMFDTIRSCATLVSPEERRGAKGWDACPEGMSPIAGHGLSAIAMKALAREADDRYASVDAFAEALDKWEAESASAELTADAQARLGETESARRPSARAYAEVIALADAALERVKTNVQAQQVRDRASAALAAIQRRSARRLWSAVAATLLVFVVGGIGYWRTRYQRNRAEARRKEAVVARNEAETQRGKAEQLAASEAEQRKLADAARKDAEDKAVELAQRKRQLDAQLEEAYWEAHNKFEGRGDPVGQLMISLAARDHVDQNQITSPRLWADLGGSALVHCPRLAYSTPAAPTWEAICYSASGDLLAAGGQFGIIKIWDVATGRERAMVEARSHAVTNVCFSPDGATLASASADDTAKLWDVEALLEQGTGREVATLLGHASDVWGVAFSPDGATLASSSYRGPVRLWDVAASLEQGAGREKATLSGHRAGVRRVCFSPDGATLASGSWDATVKLWDLATGKEKATLKGHRARVRSVSFSPDGTILASSSFDKTVRLWDVATGQERATLKGHTRWVSSVRFSPDGALVASGSYDKTIKLWDVNASIKQGRGCETATIKGHTEAVKGVAFSPDGTALAAADDARAVRFWDMSASAEQGRGLEQAALPPPSGKVHSVCFSPDGSTVAWGSADGGIRLLDVATGREKATFKGHSGEVLSVSFSPDGALLASASKDKTAKLWDVEAVLERAEAREGATLTGHSSDVTSVDFAPDGLTLATTSMDKTVKLWDVQAALRQATDRAKATLKGHTEGVYTADFSPDGSTLASGSLDLTVKLWNVATARVSKTLKGHRARVWGLQFSPNGTTIASTSRDRTIRLWDVATGGIKSTLEERAGWANSVSFSSDGSLLASGSSGHMITLWDVATGRERATLWGHSGEVRSVSFSPDGASLASGSVDNMVKLWDLAQLQKRAVLAGHGDCVGNVAFSPDGKTLASASYDGTVKLWDLPTRREKRTLRGLSRKVCAVGFSPNGGTLAIGCDDKTVRLWDTAEWQEQAVLKGHGGRVQRLSFSPDGNLLASASYDRTIKLWDVAASLKQKTGCEKATLRGHRYVVWDVQFSPDGAILASGSGDGTARLWDVASSLKQGSGITKATLRGHANMVVSVRFSPDGTVLASGSKDESIKLWDVAASLKRGRGHSMATLKWPDHDVRSLSFSPDGATLASSSGRNMVRLWDVATRRGPAGSREPTYRAKTTLRGHFSLVWSVSFSPDGTTVASSGWDKTVRLWDVAPPTQVTRDDAARFAGCQLEGFNLTALPSRAYLGRRHFVAREGFSFAPPQAPELPRNLYLQARWGERNPNHWRVAAQQGEAKALYHLAIIRERQHRDPEARDLYQKAVEASEPKQEEWAGRARSRLSQVPWLQTGAVEYAKALKHFQAEDFDAGMAVARESAVLSDADRRRLAGDLAKIAWRYFQRKAWPQTAQAYRLVIELGLDNFVARNNLAVALQATGDVDGAIEQFRRAVESNPRDSAPYYQLARLLDKKGEYQDAIENYERSAAFAKPGDGHTRYGVRRYAYLLTKLGRGSEGVDALHQWLAKDRADVDARHMLAAFLCSMGRHRNAYEVLEPVLASESPTPQAQLLASVALLAMGKTDVTADHLKAFCTKVGDAGRAKNMLANVLAWGGDLEAVAKLLRGSDAARADQFNMWLDLARAEELKRRASLDPKEQALQSAKAAPLPASPVLAYSKDLLANPSCEEPVAGESVPEWVATFGEHWGRRSSDPSARTGKSYFFCGVGPSGELRQDVSVAHYRPKIAAGQQAFAFEGYVRSWRDGKDTSRIVVEYLDQSKDRTLAAYDSGQVRSPLMWTKLEDRRLAPRDTHYIRVRLLARRYDGEECDGYFEDLSLSAITSPVDEIPDLATEQLDVPPSDAKPPAIPPRLRRWLMLRYAFDKDEGKRASDTSGHDRHGELLGACYTPAGRFGGGCRLDGHDDYFNATDFEIGDAFTVALWANIECLQKGQTIVGKHTAGGGNILLFDLRERRYHVRIRGATHQHGQAVRRWQHLALTCTSEDGKTTKATVYVDSAVVWEQVLPAAIGDSRGKPWTIGQDWDGGATSDFFEGVVDELMIFNCALSQGDIREIGGFAKNGESEKNGGDKR